MNDAHPLADQHQSNAQVFVSYATADRKEALDVCKAIERRGAKCWISTRDVQPGENYQEAIVRSLRVSRAMVLVFSEAANNSDEIKKELSLASRYHVPVMALRIEDVEPSDAFAYELSTRQWIDAFAGWDKSIDALVQRISAMPDAGKGPSRAPAVASPRRKAHHSRAAIFAICAMFLVLAGAATWWWLRPSPAAAHSMTVRLTGFQRLSTDLPVTLPYVIRDEITAAFGDQGVVGVSTAAAPPAGTAPAYALGGTIRRDGNQIRVITKLTNERSGATLWSSSTDYDAAQLSRVPRMIAIDAARMSRCGLFGASTYRKPLPDQVLADYMQYCQVTWVHSNPQKGLFSAQKVVAAAPDFSWGYSAVAESAVQSMYVNAPGPRREELRQIGLQAVDKALALDSKNSFALAQKALLIDANDRIGQERIMKQAFAAQPLDCGCEHVVYGLMLENAGRYADASDQFRRAIEMLAIDTFSELALADSLNVSGKPDEAKSHYAASAELSSDPMAADATVAVDATENGNYAAGIKAMSNPKLPFPEKQRAAVLAGYRAMMMPTNPAAKASAVNELNALPDDQKNIVVLRTLAVLGANHEAMALFVKGLGSRWDWPSLLWYPSMRGVLSEPEFPAVAQRLGLMSYWRGSRTRPDVCAAKSPPSFCTII